ncbi:hypothetical protein GCU67_18400 [Modestobacter muralis]|uniref:Uncharacterized protein n=1 Tax=Modestobacter muralis TaxID=1608614 RepID=A0A6P0EWP7_9ACTN|nr:hypothetical protein [Modestobacter muralis]NEK96121.1 hypothetical protein [Modestobacter muralis]NEN53009.1 hypothetical protein [Modestobacter muralis]
MSDEQDVVAAGRVDQGRPETGATAVVPGQRTEAQTVVQPVAQPVPQPVAAEPGTEHLTQPGVPMVGPRQHDAPAPAATDSQPVPALGQPPVGEPAPGHQPTTPVEARSRPRPRMPRPDQMIRMGPWAPVAGAAIGLLLGLVVVAFLASSANTFDQRMALVFVVLGLALLGAGGTLLADEVRLLRRGTQAVEARSANAGMIAGLLNGLTPARLLITASAFSLLLSAYVTSGS